MDRQHILNGRRNATRAGSRQREQCLSHRARAVAWAGGANGAMRVG